MNNLISNNSNTNLKEFISCDGITDVLLPFSQNISLCFNVILAYKNKDNPASHQEEMEDVAGA